MESWTTSLYLVSLASYLVPTVLAAYFGARWQAPLAFNFIKLNLAYGAYWAVLFAAFLLLRLWDAAVAVELFFDSMLFAVYGGLLVFVARFLCEMVQRPWEGIQRRITEAVAVLGIVIALLVHSMVLDAQPRVEALRFWLNGVYVFLFLGWLLILFVQSVVRLRSIRDPWKKTTLAGACLIVFLGIPFYLVDNSWPLFQVQLKWIPRGFNLQMIVVLAWNVFFTVRWFMFPVADARSDLASEELATGALDRFTAREREIVLLILQGKSNLEIGSALQVSLSTTKTHIYNIFNKTGASSRKELRTLLLRPAEV